jgi:hypothetical protein
MTTREELPSLPYSGDVLGYITISLTINNSAFRLNMFRVTNLLNVSVVTCRLQSNNIHRLAYAQYVTIIL